MNNKEKINVNTNFAKKNKNKITGSRKKTTNGANAKGHFRTIALNVRCNAYAK